MKLKISFLLLLWPFLGLYAQREKTNAVKNELANVLPGGMGIGALVPDVSLGHVAGLVLDGKRVAGARLVSDFRDKLVIIDFWATWCAPCRRFVPVMDSLQRVFAGSVVFLPVSYESNAAVGPVLASMKRVRDFELPEVTGDVVLGKLFPHRSLPHEVWIMNGRVLAITEYSQVTAAHIRAVLAGNAAMAVKRDVVIPYEKGNDLFVNGNGGMVRG